jgi:AraC-like DNA-binding protein
MLQIEQNLSTPQKVEDIAQGVGLSKRQLERIFRKVVGKSIQEFSRDLRVFYGLWLLANSDKTITAVATESGFSDISHFNRLFRATFGCAPSTLRREGADAMKLTIQRWQTAQSKTLSDMHIAAAKILADRHAAMGRPGEMTAPIAALARPPMPGIDLETLGFLQRERRPYF